MGSHIDIALHSETVGSIAFTQPDDGFAATRTASGFRVQIPAVLGFWAPSGDRSPLLLEDLRAIFWVPDATGKRLEIGTAACSSRFRDPHRKALIALAWDWTLPALAFYEKLRAGREPRFYLTISGDIRYILPGQAGREPCSVPHPFFQSGEVVYSRDVWTKMLRDLNLGDAILLEIPFRSDPPSGWEAVWGALSDARDLFDKGGSTGWNGCVSQVRLALERWQEIEKEDQGPGWQRPQPSDLQSRTKSQRTDNLRWHLIQWAHLAPHTKADEWTRDDAILALSTVRALLAVRNP
jgi:hypothetical protein